MKKVLILGSLNMDLVITAPREVKQGETVHGSGFMTNPGGKGANQAVACGKLGAAVMMGGCVGADAFGTTLVSGLQACHVNTACIRTVDGASTGVAVITVVGGDNRIILDSGANACVTTGDVDALLAHGGAGDIFLTQLENPTDVVGYALQRAKAQGMITVFNPAPMDDAVAPYLSDVDYLIPNETELAVLTGSDDVTAGIKRLTVLGVPNVIVTLGDKGYSARCGDTVFAEPCVKTNVMDTTAAGDTFCGAFVTRLSLGDDVPAALSYANRAAALTVTRRGAQCAVPTADEVAAFGG